VHRFAFGKHSGSDGVHERVEVERYQVVSLDDDTLDLLRQALSFRRIDAGFMLRPQRPLSGGTLRERATLRT
jgi:hypothetical protein